MNKTQCKLCGHERPTNLREQCPICGAKEWLFHLYLRPGEAKGSTVAVVIIIVTALVVIIGLALMFLVLGKQIAFMPQPVLLPVITSVGIVLSMIIAQLEVL